MRKLTNILLICLFSLFGTGCQQHNKDHDNYSSFQQEQINHLNTLKDQFVLSVGKIDLPDGGYGVQSLDADKGSLYATYYFIKSLKIINSNYSLSDEELITLKKMLDNSLDSFSKTGDFSMYDLFYITEILDEYKLLNTDTKEEIVSLLVKLRHENNTSYMLNLKSEENDEEKNILATTMAIHIYKLLDQNVRLETINWIKQLHEKYTATTVNVRYFTLITKSMLDLKIEVKMNREKFGLLQNEISKRVLNNESSLLDLNTAIDIAQTFNLYLSEIEIKALTNRILINQNNDGGWSLFLKGYSDDQGIFLAIKILSIFNHEIPKSETLKETILEQRSTNGGFISINQAEFSLENTFIVNELNSLYQLKNKNYRSTMSRLEKMTSEVDFDKLSTSQKFLYVANLSSYGLEIKPEIVKILERDYDQLNRPSLKVDEISNLFFTVLSLKWLGNNENFSSMKLKSVENDYYANIYKLAILGMCNKLDLEDVNNFLSEYSLNIEEAINKEDYLVIWILSQTFNKKDTGERSKLINSDLHVLLKRALNKSIMSMLKHDNELSIPKLYYTWDAYNNVR